MSAAKEQPPVESDELESAWIAGMLARMDTEPSVPPKWYTEEQRDYWFWGYER